MFDVIWTDPNKELVGEHRAKKETKRDRKQENEKSISSRFSVSTKSSRSSTDTPFGFLRSRALRKTDKARSKTRAIISSGLLTPSFSSSRSPLSISSSRGSAGPVQVGDSSSVYSNQINKPKVKQSGPEAVQVIQTLGPSSYVTKRTEVSWKMRSSDGEQDVISEVYISSEPDQHQPLTPPSSPPATENMPLPLFGSDLPVVLLPGLRLPSRSKAPIETVFKPNNPESWRPPEEWDRLKPEATLKDSSMEIHEVGDDNQIDGDFYTLQTKVQEMAAASDLSTLSRLRGLWKHINYRGSDEAELEKSLLMLSVLHHLEKEPQRLTFDPVDTAIETQKILVLFESQTIASYLAAFYSYQDIYHLSPVPLRSTRFPTVHPVFIRSPSTSALPLSQRFDTIYSLIMPALFSSAHIPVILENIRKSLKPGGCLQVTLIDPLPCEETLGPVMRAWFDKHLLPNFGGEFGYLKKTGPSKLFPGWMLTANLRGLGSTLSTTVFCALPESVRHGQHNEDPFVDKKPSDTEKEIRAEIRSYIGRSLWIEVWGPFVSPFVMQNNKWWWQDEACARECLEHKTCWEYRIIKGVRVD